jgi:stearoyl-CoA desaturase (delta-9 desaturase)
MIFNNWTVFGGILDLTVAGLTKWTVAVTHITILSVTIYLHRYVAHRGFELNVYVQHFFRFWLWLTTGQNTKEWASIHRKHHAHVDAVGDPHSPVVAGITTPLDWVRWVLFEGVHSYVVAGRDKASLEKFSHGMPDDWVENNIYTPHSFLGVGILLGVINVTLLGLPGLIIWGVQALWIPIFAAGIINGLGHGFGYRNYKHGKEYPNVASSTNIFPWGLLIGGEELHNNHHADGASPCFARKWYEIDEGWVLIRGLCFLRLAKLRKPLVAKNHLQSSATR